MTKHIKQFANHAAYVAFTQSEAYVLPNVSHCILEDEMHYNPSSRLQDGFYIKDVMLDIQEDTYIGTLGPGCNAITYEGPRDLNADDYCVSNAIAFGIWAVKNGSPIPSSQLTITTTGHITSADLAISDQEPADYDFGTHWLSGSQGMLDLGSNDTITISCPQYNYSLVITFDFYQEIVFSDTTEWVDNECSCQGTIDYFNVSSSAPYTTLTVHVPQYYKTDDYDAISSMILTLAYCRENEGVKRLKMDSNNYFTVNSSSLIGDTVDYESLGITHSISITPVSEMSPNSSTTLTFRDYSSNTVVFTAVIYNDINTGNSHGGSGGGSSSDRVEFTSESSSNYQYYIDSNGPSNGGTWQTSVICPSGTLLTYTDHDVPLDGFSQTKNGWTISFSTAYDSTTSNSLGTNVYTVTIDIQKAGNVASTVNYDFVISAYSSDSNIAGMVQWELSSPEAIYS